MADRIFQDNMHQRTEERQLNSCVNGHTDLDAMLRFKLNINVIETYIGQSYRHHSIRCH